MRLAFIASDKIGLILINKRWQPYLIVIHNSQLIPVKKEDYSDAIVDGLTTLEINLKIRSGLIYLANEVVGKYCKSLQAIVSPVFYVKNHPLRK